jgi:hypothetical protein
MLTGLLQSRRSPPAATGRDESVDGATSSTRPRPASRQIGIAASERPFGSGSAVTQRACSINWSEFAFPVLKPAPTPPES